MKQICNSDLCLKKVLSINPVSDACSNPLAMAAGISQMIFVFLQMFMVFKYSNVIVNRSKRLAKIAFMHCLSTDICIWISTIINETLDYILLDAYKSMDPPKGPEYYGKFLRTCAFIETNLLILTKGHSPYHVNYCMSRK